MERCDVIQRLLDFYPSPRYLELGVNQGHTFHSLKAAHKVGVDPEYLFDVGAARIKHPENRYEVATSDEFFSKSQPNRFDVIFIDGLHVFEQVLRDFLNSATVLASNGIIIVDDVIPRDYISSLPDIQAMYTMRSAIGSADATWMGDVYKLIFFIAAFVPAYSFATIEENHGQTICWREPRRPTNTTIKSIADLEYSAVTLEKEIFNVKPFASIVQMLIDRRKAEPH